LPRRIRSADHVDLLALAFRGDGHCGPVVHTATFQRFAAVRRELVVGDAGGDDDRVRFDGPAVAEADRALGAVDLQSNGRAGGDEFGAELLRLSARAISQLAAGYPVRKTQIVFDPRALAGLAPRRSRLYQPRAQTFGSAVDGGGQARGPSADHDQVVEVL